MLDDIHHVSVTLTEASWNAIMELITSGCASRSDSWQNWGKNINTIIQQAILQQQPRQPDPPASPSPQPAAMRTITASYNYLEDDDFDDELLDELDDFDEDEAFDYEDDEDDDFDEYDDDKDDPDYLDDGLYEYWDGEGDYADY